MATAALAAVADAGLRLSDYALSLEFFHLKAVAGVKAIRRRHPTSCFNLNTRTFLGSE